jgi:hypothetical protein
VPLRLDGRRLDSFLLAPMFSFGAIAQPVELGFLKARGCPPWRVPMGTFDAFRSRPMGEIGRLGRMLADNKFKVMDRLIVNVVEQAPQIGAADIAYLYVAHLGVVRVGRSTEWRTTTSKSHLYWVKDGVVIRHETFAMKPTTLSVTCYVSAGGLTTDLTTLQLVASNAKAERTADVMRAMSSLLAQTRDFQFPSVVSWARAGDRISGGALGALGTLSLPLLPLSLLMLWASHRLLKNAGDAEETLVDQVQAGYPLLQQLWRASYAGYLPAEEDVTC